jgi:hypothetical protein
VYEKSWVAISDKKLKSNRCTILAAIGAVVKQNFIRKESYGIDSSHTFKVISLFQKG